MEKKKSNSWLIILIILLVGIGVGFGVYKWTSMNTNTNSNQENKEQKEPVETEEAGLTAEVEKKLKRWVDVASHYNSAISSESTMKLFAKGVNALNAKTKLIMTYNSVIEEKGIYEQDTFELTKEDINSMEATTDKAFMYNEPVRIMKISDFDKTYEELFQEKPVYALKDLEFGCPVPMAMDKAKDRIYLFDRCGGTSPLYSNSQIESVTEIDGGYQVSQVIKILNADENDKLVESYQIKWFFDKDLKFVKSEGQKLN